MRRTEAETLCTRTFRRRGGTLSTTDGFRSSYLALAPALEVQYTMARRAIHNELYGPTGQRMIFSIRWANRLTHRRISPRRQQAGGPTRRWRIPGRLLHRARQRQRTHTVPGRSPRTLVDTLSDACVLCCRHEARVLCCCGASVPHCGACACGRAPVCARQIGAPNTGENKSSLRRPRSR